MKFCRSFLTWTFKVLTIYIIQGMDRWTSFSVSSSCSTWTNIFRKPCQRQGKKREGTRAAVSFVCHRWKPWPVSWSKRDRHRPTNIFFLLQGRTNRAHHCYEMQCTPLWCNPSVQRRARCAASHVFFSLFRWARNRRDSCHLLHRGTDPPSGLMEPIQRRTRGRRSTHRGSAPARGAAGFDEGAADRVLGLHDLICADGNTWCPIDGVLLLQKSRHCQAGEMVNASCLISSA